ncbi:DNA cytosine methyltransferase [Paenibacillus chitinolyticus]|uniref:DNA cytosine methyltransferase n=1 Tax=Paenibacillus chitinolyticus TaxID=79263 RepID=UPI003555F8A8
MKVVGLFSGAGGLELGFKQQGFNICYALDYMPEACETNRKNLGNHIVCKDIRDVRHTEIPGGGGYIYLIGASCRGLSKANRQTSILENPDNQLTYEWVNILKQNKPDIFVSENVPDILEKFDGALAKEIINQLSDLYEIEIKVLNASDYGVPQLRKRCIMIGSRVGVIRHPKGNPDFKKTVGEALSNLSDDLPNQKDIRRSSLQTISRFKEVPQGGNWRNIKEFEGKSKHSIVYRRLALNEVAPTFPHAAKNLVQHPTEDRILSVRECARIMSFPDDFIFYGGLTAKYQQVANAVPPLMSEAIARQVKSHLIKNNIWDKNRVNMTQNYKNDIIA